MRLTAPTKIVFYISLVLMAAGLVFFFFLDDQKDLGFYATLAGGLLMTAGVALKGF